MQHQKNCSKHGELLPEQIIVEPNKTAKRGYTLRCILCKHEKDLTYRSKNRITLCEKNKEYKKNNRDKVNEWNRNDRNKKPELYAAASKRNRDKLGSLRNVIEISRIRGITTDQYQQRLEKQNYKCAICNLPEVKISRNGKVAQLCLDHNHKTGKVRGFLCHACNLFIGHFKESEEIMLNAISYLKKHGALCK